MRNIFVIGGICADISVRPMAAALGRDSNPSRIGLGVGGVGFNIACRLAELGRGVRMTAAVGNDGFYPLIKAAAERAGVTLLPACAGRSGVYVCVEGADGDMDVAYSDLEDTERNITPELIGPLLGEINSCAACVLDGNLTAGAIEFAARNISVPIIADPVSTKKALRFLPVMDRLFAFKPNIYEARAITGLETPADCARAIVDMGCGAAFVSCGAEGICWADKTGFGFEKAAPVAGATKGAGDAACAMLVNVLLSGGTAAEAAREANRFAAERIKSNLQ